MGKKDLQCLFIGEQSSIYDDLLLALKGFGLNIQAKLVDIEKKSVARELKKLKSASLVFISDEVPFSVGTLSDLVWQYASDTIVVIVTEKTASTSLKKPFNNTQFSKLHFNKEKKSTNLHLQYLIEAVQVQWSFRRCKRLLGVSEKRCQWLVDSSNEAISFISRELHLYANTSYLGLFGINSVYELPALPIEELIVNDEYHLFKAFVKKQILRHDMNRSLVLSFNKTNGRVFRAKVHAIPSVFKGNKCLQLWVHPLNKLELNEMDDNVLTGDKNNENPFEFNQPDEVLKKVKSTPTPTSILRGIIKRKEAIISAQKLVDMKTNENKHEKVIVSHILSLTVPVAQRVGIDDLLLEAGGVDLAENRQIFWDKVKLTRLLQILIKKSNLHVNLFVRLSEASLLDKSFAEWFLPGLNRIGNKAAHLTFLLPSELSQDQALPFIKTVKALRKANCQIALDDFSVSTRSLRLLKHIKPEYVRLSLAWVKQIEGNSERELALGSFIRQIESKKIKVVAPCGFSDDMRKLFALSGVSFCQERTLKTD
jgi:PAS domain-containing protein